MMKRNTLILLALAVLTSSTTGCCNRGRNPFRRGSPCCGTAAAAPAMIGAPVALQQPAPAPQVIPQIVQPQVVVPQFVRPQIVMPQPTIQCCPQVCPPCPTPCIPCEPGCVGNGVWSGGYVDGSGRVVEGDCQDCGPTTTYDSVLPESETYETDPAPKE